MQTKKAPSSITAERWLFQLAQMSSFFCERLTIQNQPISLCKHKVVMFAPVYISRAVTHINIQSIPLLGIVRSRSHRRRVVSCIRLPVGIAVPVYFPDFFRRSLACSCSSMSLFQNACTLSYSSCEGGFLLRSSLSSASLFGESQSIWKSSSIYSSCANPFTSILYRVSFSRCQNRCLA